MKVLVTGARGFIGRNLVVSLRRAGLTVAEMGSDSSWPEWIEGVRDAGVVYHLAGASRSREEADLTAGNVGSLARLIGASDEVAGRAPEAERPLIVLASSTQAAYNNSYGRSKLAAERALAGYSALARIPAVIYRLPGVFGKWSRPEHNSVVSTFCHRIAHDQPLEIADPARLLELVYVDDVVAHLLTHLDVRPQGMVRAEVQPTFTVRVGDLAHSIRRLHDLRAARELPDLSDPFTRRLLATYTSYLPARELVRLLPPPSNGQQGIAELFESASGGQFGVSRTPPGGRRGDYYHDRKVERFWVLEGEARVRLRPVGGREALERRITGAERVVVDVPPGTVHSIENVGRGDLVVAHWCSEAFDPEHPDVHGSDLVDA